MKIVFISNYYNHHQSSVSEHLYQLTGGSYYFIETTPMERERLELGWQQTEKPPFVLNTFSNLSLKEECIRLISEADFLIVGSADYMFYKRRLREKKPIYFFKERQLKNGLELHKYFYRFIKWHVQLANKNTFLLCASGFTYSDYLIFGLFRNKSYNWGYFPEFNDLDPYSVLREKTKKSIIWAGRFIDWKHPESMIVLASFLLENGIDDFQINMIGCGPLLDCIRKQIESKKLQKYVHLLGNLSPSQVREKMISHSIFVSSSGREEGWGAVINESMNSVCAVIASNEAGAVPLLINNGVNGLVYKSKDWKDLCKKVLLLVANDEYREKIAASAYETIATLWNPKVASERLYMMLESKLACKKISFNNGPCSASKKINKSWYLKK